MGCDWWEVEGICLSGLNFLSKTGNKVMKGCEDRVERLEFWRQGRNRRVEGWLDQGTQHHWTLSRPAPVALLVSMGASKMVVCGQLQKKGPGEADNQKDPGWWEHGNENGAEILKEYVKSDCNTWSINLIWKEKGIREVNRKQILVRLNFWSYRTRGSERD